MVGGPACGPAFADAASTAALLEQLRSSRLQPERAVTIEGLSLAIGEARLKIVSGALVPAAPVGGQFREMVFLGEARLLVEPPNRVEGGQLARFTGSERFEETISEAVLAIGLDAASDALFRPNDRPVDAAAVGRAERIFETWLSGPERRILGVDWALLRDASGDRLYDGFFAGWFRGEEVGTFHYLVEPDAPEQVTLGQFTPLDVTAKQEKKLKRQIHKSQRRGRLIGLDVAELGAWETWMSTTLTSNGDPRPGFSPFDVEHYELEVSLDPRGEDGEGVARIDLAPRSTASRFVVLSLNRDLAVSSVVDGAGRNLFFEQEDGGLLVAFDEAPSTSEMTRLEIRYSGKMIRRSSSGVFAVVDTVGWYPGAGFTDRATYDVTFRWPSKFDLLASGKLAESGEAKGQNWARYELTRPALAFGFEVGKFKTWTETVQGVEITLASDSMARQLSDPEKLLDTVGKSIEYFGAIFGDYPYDSLQVVLAPREFSQSLPGFVTLSTLMMMEGFLAEYVGLEDPRTVVAHEVAHQWFGHEIGSAGYRDVWLSEALSNYASVLYARNVLAGRLRNWTGPTSGWQDDLARMTLEGVPVEGVGPIALGERLDSAKTSGAYFAITYKKGAVVVDMLARAFGEETFIQVLRAIVHAARGHNLSTEDFLRLAGEATGADLTDFADQFIYGTGLADVYYNYEFTRDPEHGWIVRIATEQASKASYRYTVVETESGGFDVRRVYDPPTQSVGSNLIVPIQVAVFSPEAESRLTNVGGKDLDPAVAGNLMLLARASLIGSKTIDVPSQYEPKEVWLDRHAEVFGRFYNERRHPKRTLHRRGLVAWADGDSDSAIHLLERAALAQMRAGPQYEDVNRVALEFETEDLDARIQLALARVRLDAGRDASVALKEASRLIHQDSYASRRATLKVLEARAALAAGDLSRAKRSARRAIELGLPSQARAEPYLLLAIIAHQSGSDSDLREALDEAAELNGDGSLLPIGV